MFVCHSGLSGIFQMVSRRIPDLPAGRQARSLAGMTALFAIQTGYGQALINKSEIVKEGE